MSKPPYALFIAFAAVCAIVIPYLAINNKGAANAAEVTVADHDEDMKALFAGSCGACHTLAAAGTDGIVGPNLDDTLAPGGQGAYDSSYPRTLSAIACGLAGRMPAKIVSGDQAQELAAFVAAYAGQLGVDDEALADTREAAKPPADPCPEPGEDPGAGA